jgi:pilus assembly protein Flp/PilA
MQAQSTATKVAVRLAVGEANYREQLTLPLTAPVNLVGCRSNGRPRESEDAMKSLAAKVQRFLVSEDGPTAVEYAVMLALIVIVCLTAIRAIGTNANTTFQNVADEIG